jgi:hypothetical protein
MACFLEAHNSVSRLPHPVAKGISKPLATPRIASSISGTPASAKLYRQPTTNLEAITRNLPDPMRNTLHHHGRKPALETRVATAASTAHVETAAFGRLAKAKPSDL